MKVRIWFSSFLIIGLLFSLNLYTNTVHASTPVVHAVLFYSPNCGHCYKVITEDLPPLAEKYNDQLVIAGIDVTVAEGQNLYQAAVQRFNIPNERIGVPTLVVGETVLVGSQEIPQKFPGLIEQGLAAGGVEWPDIPNLKEKLQLSESVEQTETENQTQSVSLVDRFAQDVTGNSLAVVVLLGMIASVFGVGYTFLKDTQGNPQSWPGWVIPVLAIIGFGVAIYLSYVEVTQSEAICGPVGDCNSVQQSPYAHLFGVLSVGLMGVAGYAAILVTWLVQHFGPDSWRSPSNLAIWGMAWFGIIFSLYLTFLEPFVIGATCIWCITSAVIMTLILWASTGPAKQAWPS